MHFKRKSRGRRGRILMGPLFFIVLVFLACGCVAGKIVSIPQMSETEVRDLAAGVKGARVVFVGEVHNARAHHRLQLDVIRALHEGGFDVAVGMEMFRAGSQGELDRWVAGELPEREFKDVYYDQWHIPFRQYRGIFRYARDNRIPLVALNVPRSVTRKVFKEGAVSLSGSEAEGLSGIECDADEKYEELIRDAMGDHPELKDSYERFCETQMVWDMAMAINVVRHLKENPGRIMVVVTGSAHAWRRGVARQMRKLPSGAGLELVVIIPELPGKLDRTNIQEEDADYLLLDPWMLPFGG